MKKLISLITLLGISSLLESCSNDGKKKSTSLSGDTPHEGSLEDTETSDDDALRKGGGSDKDKPGGGLDDPNMENPPSEESMMISCSDKPKGRTYKGFGGVELASGREDKIPPLGNRYRVKPFVALSADITRVFGTAPKSLTGAASTFPAAEARWYIEPIASGVTMFATFRIAFEGGLTTAASDTMLSAAPTPESAQAVCSKYIELAWQRPGTTAEINHCKNVAIMATAKETDPKSRWAYTIASIISAADFVSY